MKDWMNRFENIEKLIEFVIRYRDKISALFRMMFPRNEFRQLEDIYLLFREEGPRLVWYGSFVKLEYVSHGQFVAIGRRPGEPKRNWVSYIRFDKFGKRIVGEGHYKYPNRDNDFGTQQFYYAAKDRSLRVIVDNRSVSWGKKDVHTLWIPARLVNTVVANETE